MFDIGYSELLVIAIVLIVVVGPKDLPKMLRAFGKTMTKFRQMSGDFQRQFNDALKETELDEVRKTIADVRKLDPRQQVRDALNPLRDVGNSLKADLNKAVQAPIAPAAVAAPSVLDKPVDVTMGGAKPVAQVNDTQKKSSAAKKIAKAKTDKAEAGPVSKQAFKSDPKAKPAPKAKMATSAISEVKAGKPVSKSFAKNKATATKASIAKSLTTKTEAVAAKPAKSKGRSIK